MLVIFGGTGALGLTIINKLNSDTNKLNSDISSIEYKVKKLSEWEEKALKSFTEIEKYKNNAISNISSYVQDLKQDLKKDLDTASQSSVKQATLSINNIINEMTTPLREQLSKEVKNLIIRISLLGDNEFKIKNTLEKLENRLLDVEKNYIPTWELKDRLKHIGSIRINELIIDK